MIDEARRDPGVFASALVGAPLWDHQLAFVRSPARIRTMCCGRRAGKTHVMAIEALHVAFVKADARVLVCSAGEDSAKDLLATCSMLASASPLLAGSVLDDTATLLTLSNGSTIRAVPASERRIRGKGVDLLLIDEAAYVADEIWEAAQWSMLDRPGSRVILSSTPRGRRDRFFARYFFMAKNGPVEEAGVSVESFHWPSTVSPKVDKNLVEFWRINEDSRKFAREVLAEWVDESGQYFTADELDANVAPFTQLDPTAAGGAYVVGGVDWGGRNDSNTVAMLGVLGAVEGTDKRPVFVAATLRERLGSMNEWARDLAAWSDPTAGGFAVYALASEANGVGQAPTELLAEEFHKREVYRRWAVKPVWTTNARKANGFGQMKLLFQQGRLILPADPALRRQLEALEFTETESGNTTISVPAAKGHDDLAMAMCQAMSCLRISGSGPDEFLVGHGDLLETSAGAQIYERPLMAWGHRAFRSPAGLEDTERGW